MNATADLVSSALESETFEVAENIGDTDLLLASDGTTTSSTG